MSAFTFDFDLEDDLDESFDAIPPPKPSVPPIDAVLAFEGAELLAEEIPLSELVRTHRSIPTSSSPRSSPSILTRSTALRAPRSPLILAIRAAIWRPHALAEGPLRCALPVAGAGTRRASRTSRRAGGPRPRRV